MKYSMYILTIFLLMPVVLFNGCSIAATVTDINRKATNLRSIKLSERGGLKVLDGSLERDIKLKDIKTIHIQSDESKTFNRELFCLAKIVFKDGTTIGSFNDAKGQKAKAYIGVNDILQGKKTKDRFRIPLIDVLKIEIKAR